MINLNFFKKNFARLSGSKNSAKKLGLDKLYNLDLNLVNNLNTNDSDFLKNSIFFDDHYPVMWRKILGIIDDHVIEKKKDIKIFCDLTLGCGNHTKLILDKYPNVYMAGVEIDNKLVDYTSHKLHDYIADDRLIIIEDNYVCIDEIKVSELFEQVDKTKLVVPEKKKFDFILLDLGYNSMQLEDKEKGISYKNPTSNLDMRYDMNNDDKSKASDILNNLSELELQEIFYKYGDEKNYEAIANAIIKQRDIKLFETVEDFIKVIDETYEFGNKRFNIYTRLFQALRIAVNYELVNVQRLLNKVFLNLEVGGVLAVISFHSAEDRIVKTALKEAEKLKLGKNIIKKGERPDEIEIEENYKSHSAILRAFKLNPST
jgi:16S rRNA (cytosine1402-N4)-methyltransferase